MKNNLFLSKMRLRLLSLLLGSAMALCACGGAGGGPASESVALSPTTAAPTVTPTVTPPVAKRATPTATAMGTPTGSVASATIGAAGGKVRSPDGKIALAIPAGALAADTVISIQPLTNMAHGKIGAAYRLTPESLMFLKPVTLTFTYTDQDFLGTAAEVLGAAFQTKDGFWQWGGDATVDTARKTVSVNSSHFSAWSLVEGLVLRPVEKTVKVNASVALQVVPCYARPEGADLRAPLVGYKCDLDSLGTPLQRAQEWTINGHPGGGSDGTVSGDGSSAIYTAPAFLPTPTTVAVSATLNWGPKGKVLLVSNHTIVVAGDEGE